MGQIQWPEAIGSSVKHVHLGRHLNQSRNKNFKQKMNANKIWIK